jgi:hypothetical protein
MANCVGYNCSDFEEFLLNDCSEELLGGQDQAVLIKCGTIISDPSDGTEILAQIALGNAVLIQNVKVGIDAPSPIEVDSNIALRSSKVVNYDRTATWMDGNVNNNNVNTFYPSILNGAAIGGAIIYENGNDTKAVTFINEPIQMVGGRILPADNNEFQRFEATLKWKSLTDPTRHAAPSGVFD